MLLIFIGASWWVIAKVDVEASLDAINKSNLWLILLTIPCILLSHVVRAFRWQLLLKSTGYSSGIHNTFKAVMIGYAANTILPRSGEIIRPWVLSQRTTTTYAAALGSIVVERFIDVLTLLFAMITVLVFQQEYIQAVVPSFTIQTLTGVVIIPLVVLAGILVAVVLNSWGRSLCIKIIRLISDNLADYVGTALEEVSGSIKGLLSFSMFAQLTMLTILLWLLYIAPVWLLAHALPLSSQAPSLIQSATILILISIGVTIAPTPGALGVYQAFAQTALVAVSGSTQSEGFAFAILAWLTNYGLALLVGGVYWLVETLHGSFTQKPKA